MTEEPATRELPLVANRTDTKSLHGGTQGDGQRRLVVSKPAFH